MKVISEYTIKKLIQTKLLENYKKKLLTEDADEDSTDFKNQIISSGIIEALWLFFNDSKYENKLGILKRLKDNMSNKFNEILSSQSLTNFKSKINDLINEFINLLKTNPAFTNNLLSSHPLFTNLLAYNDIILERFNKKLANITTTNAYTRHGDINIISNHISRGITYTGVKVLSGIKDNILEILDELLGKSPQILTIEQVQQKIKNLLPVTTVNLNNNITQKVDEPKSQQTQTSQQNQQQQLTTKQAKIIAFAEIQDELNLSNRQLKKLSRKLTTLAQQRTNNEEESKRYKDLLIALMIKKQGGNDVAANVIGNNVSQNMSAEQQQNAVKDAETALIKQLKETEKSFDNLNNYIHYKKFEKPNQFSAEIKKNSKLKNNVKIENNILRECSYVRLARALFDKAKLKKSEAETNFDYYGSVHIDELNRQLTLQIDSILIEEEIVKISEDVKNKCKQFFDASNKTADDQIFNINNLKNENTNLEVYRLKNWIKEYFKNEKIYTKYIAINSNFVKFIQLKVLSEICGLQTASDALKNFKTTPCISDTIDNLKSQSENASDTNTPKTSTTKECFKKNNDSHTDNFKLYSARLAGVNTSDEYRIKIAEYLLNNSAPKDFGFINKNDVEKAAYAQKLKKEGLNTDKIAKALEILYPKAGDYKTTGKQEKWIANYFLNINADEIIATAITSP